MHLRVSFDLERLARRSNALVATQLGVELKKAERARAFRLALQSLVRRFEERQEKRRGSSGGRAEPLEDARRQTLQKHVFNPSAPDAWPARAAAILHGLQPLDAPLLPEKPCRPGGPSLVSLDPLSYAAWLFGGPPEARFMSDMQALTIYFDPLRELRVLWIGHTTDAKMAWQALTSETDDFANWASVAPAYDEWLAAACSRS
jgi:hypothetical protein